jgi:hypothetical protein
MNLVLAKVGWITTLQRSVLYMGVVSDQADECLIQAEHVTVLWIAVS